MIKKFLLPLLATVAFAAPATAAITITTQTRSFTLSTLDDAAITARASNFQNFNAAGLTGRRLLGVKLTVDYNINGRVDATNNATGGTANSRRRNVSATYVLNAATSGEGFSVSGSNSQTHAVNNVAGLGTVRTLNQLNPLFSVTQTLTSNLSNFLTGTVTLSTDASALFSSLPAADVVYSAPSITGGQALLTLDYISDIPEPATWSLLLVGFGMVGFAARRRQAALAA